MYVDALTLAAITDELQTLIGGARIEDVIQPTPHAIAIQCWTGSRSPWLYLSAHPQLARVHLTSEKPRKLTAEPPPFVMLLRKYLEGCRVMAVQQPRWERLLEIGFGRHSGASQDEAPSPQVWLIIEVMGRISNIILRDTNGVILGSLRQVSAEVNRYRVIAPHEPYKYPPPQQRLLHGQQAPRLDGVTVTGDDLRLAAQAGGKKPGAEQRLWQMLAEQMMGFSQLLAREVVYRASGDVEALTGPDTPWERLAEQTRALASLIDSRDWQPTLVQKPESRTPAAFAVYELQQYEGWPSRQFERVNDLLDAYFRGVEWRDALQSAKADVTRALQTHRERSRRKAEALARDLAETQAGERLRMEGEILLAFGQEITHGQTSFTIENPFADGNTPEQLKIALDPQLSAVENANQRFARYHKLRRAGQQIPEQIEHNQAQLAQIEQLATDLLLAEIPAEVAHVRAEVVAAGYLRGKREKQDARRHAGKGGKGGKSGKGQKSSRQDAGGEPLRRQSADGFTLLIGKNSRQNEEVTFREAGSNDLWLHARGVPGAHVIIKSGGRLVPRSTIEQAARLAAYYSQSRGNTAVPVDYTQQRYVRHMKGGGPGMVIYERERTISVPPQDS
ncbi:MAG TPA: NFACT RNA binding domain-containing protein, partial [Ktedonobacterales bacterium]